MQAGVVYPRGHLFDEAKAGGITSGNGVAMANYIRPSLPQKIENKNAFLAEFEGQLKNAQGKDLLYSSEFLFLDSGEKTQNIKLLVDKYEYKVIVIYLVRDISGAAYSVYSQRIKRHGEVRSFSEFIKDWRPHYFIAIKNIIESFGIDCLRVYNFDETRDKLSELFFREILRVDFLPPERILVNRSLSRREIEILRLINAAYPNDSRVSQFVINALIAMKKTRYAEFGINRADAASLERRFAGEVASVNKFVIGRPIRIYDNIAGDVEVYKLSGVERLITSIVARFVFVVLSRV